jgi:uncharacterized protein (TIGR02444 family)
VRFWDWALAAYAGPGVARACLELQDRHGQCIPYLLWAAWAAAEGRPLTIDQLSAGAALAARWDDAVGQPLRQARRALKPVMPGVEDAPREALRTQAKALELMAEQTLMQALEALAPPPSAARLPAATALAAAVQAWRAPASPEALAPLVLALG